MRYQDSEWMALPLRDRPSFYDLAKDDLIELSPIEADGHPIGRDPREIPKEVLARYFRVEPGGAGNGRVVRAKCLDCCCYQESEIRKCTMLACPFSSRKASPAAMAALQKARAARNAPVECFCCHIFIAIKNFQPVFRRN
jgi:hypothetical protein